MGLDFFVGDVMMEASFCFFGHVYLAVGANPTSHIFGQVLFGN